MNEFNSNRIKELRIKNKISQKTLGGYLGISDRAVSKWESGRGYPNIDSLKAIACFFSVTIDELLSSDEVLTIAEADHQQKESGFRDLVFGLLDCSVAMFFCLPLLAQRTDGMVEAVSLLSVTQIAFPVKAAYFAAVIAAILLGILTLALQNHHGKRWLYSKHRLSLLLNSLGVLLFIISLQPYAASFLFLFLLIKILILAKKP